MYSPQCTELEDFFEHLERIHDIEKFVEARDRFERAVAQPTLEADFAEREGEPLFI